MQMWRGRLYTYGYTVTIGMTPALRWTAVRAILVLHNCEGQSHKTVSMHRPQHLKRTESRERIRTEVRLLTSLTPYR